MNWISVKDRLPEESGEYLVYVQYPCYEEPIRSVVNYDQYCEAFGEWREFFDPHTLGWVGSEFEELDVLFWMPLPEPPEVEQ